LRSKGSGEPGMSERAVPFYCPYCGDEDLRPSEAAHGAWYCAACLRTFTLKMIGIGVPS
jgi:ribosomal protein L37AE/L43A